MVFDHEVADGKDNLERDKRLKKKQNKEPKRM